MTHQTNSNEQLLASIQVIDGLFNQAALKDLLYFYHAELWHANWKTSGTDYTFWGTRLLGTGQADTLSNCEHQFAESARNAFLGRIWYAIRDLFLPDHELIRCAGAAYTYGRDGAIHTDNDEPGYASMLLYIHPEWQSSWGGEIGYYSLDQSELLTMIAPTPGRLIIAPGNIPHRPFAPGRNVDQLRACLNFRSRPKKVNE